MQPILITLNQIKACNPCSDGWARILEARGGAAANYDAPFPLADAIKSNGLDDVLWALRCLPEHGALWRRYARWCALQVIHLWDAPDVVRQYLETGDEALREEARQAAEAAEAWAAEAWAAEAAAGAAWAAEAAGAAAAWAAAGAEAAERQAQQAELEQILAAGEWVE